MASKLAVGSSDTNYNIGQVYAVYVAQQPLYSCLREGLRNLTMTCMDQNYLVAVAEVVDAAYTAAANKFADVIGIGLVDMTYLEVCIVCVIGTEVVVVGIAAGAISIRIHLAKNLELGAFRCCGTLLILTTSHIFLLCPRYP